MGNGDIIFTYKPSALDIGLLNDHDGYHENDLYYLEVCALNELCGNYEEIFRAEVGETFRCRVDAERWAAAAEDLRALGRGAGGEKLWSFDAPALVCVNRYICKRNILTRLDEFV